MKDPIRRGELKGVGSNPNHLDFEHIKKQLEQGGPKKSAFSNFFDSLKPKEPRKD